MPSCCMENCPPWPRRRATAGPGAPGLAETLGISKRTVEGLLKQLRDRGHIRMEVDRDPENQEVLCRKISIWRVTWLHCTPSP